jgi:putative colanic acid biosynthesis UDP-glucose lipid carrier transferase
MKMHQGILGSHQKLLDFLNRVMDVCLLGVGLAVTHAINNRPWLVTSTLLYLFAVLCFQLGAALTGIYASQRSTTTREQLFQIFMALLGTFALIIIASVSLRLHGLTSRMFLWSWFSLSFGMLGTWRIFVRKSLALVRRRGINTRQAAIVGAGRLGLTLAQKFEENPWMGIEITAFYDEETRATEIGEIPVIPNIEQILTDARQGYFRQVYITLPLSAECQVRRIINELSDSACSVYLIPDIFIFDLLHARQTTIDGLPAISIYDSPFSLADSVIKRAFDIVGSLAILSLIALPMLAIAIAVKLTSRGPIIFRQIRYGLDGKPIEVWKFRTMNATDNGSVVIQAKKNDARLTPIGGFLRQTSLDELPQFINVLQGHMSIVGPRPHAVAHNEEYRKRIKGYMQRHKVKPGITGWAQVNGWRGETDTLEKMEKRVQFDLAYIRNWNVWLDFKIVFLTIFKGFVNRNAY